MEQNWEQAILHEIIRALESAGYDPQIQLHGYLETGMDYFITRKENARERIKSLDPETIRAFLNGK